MFGMLPMTLMEGKKHNSQRKESPFSDLRQKKNKDEIVKFNVKLINLPGFLLIRLFEY